MSAPLQDRLRRLRRPGPLPDLERLERDLLGGVPEELSLKRRLERLVAVAHRRGPREARDPVGIPVEELVQGVKERNQRGEFFLIDSELHLESRHGDARLSRLRALAPGTVATLTGEPELEAFDLSRAVFLDTETTGLAGGTGTAAFLVGIGFVDGDRFRVRQYFMRDYHEEPALLVGLAGELRRFSHLVTFNGRMFDAPLLETRYGLLRERFPLADVPHLDLLLPARRLWKARLESCRLQTLETELLGLRRKADVPGEEIPRIYFDYVRRRDARALVGVLEHNRVDVVSLAALAVHACQWVEEGRAEDPRDVYSLARVLDRARQPERADVFYRRALLAADGPYRVAALLRLAARARRQGNWREATARWRQAAAAGEGEALRALAVHHEHRERDFRAALVAVDRGLGLMGGSDDPRSRRMAEAFRRRKGRLLGKLARAKNESRTGGTPPGHG